MAAFKGRIVKVLSVFILVALFCAPSFGNTCKSYFWVVEVNPAGQLIGTTSVSQMKWLRKKEAKEFPALCLSSENPTYIIIWSAARVAQYSGTENVPASYTTFNVNGRFDGNYSATTPSGPVNGQVSGDVDGKGSTTTYSTVPVTVTSDDCYAYVFRSRGPTVQDDIRNGIKNPILLWGGLAASRGDSTNSRNPTNQLAFTLGRLLLKEPTQLALERSLSYIVGSR